MWLWLPLKHIRPRGACVRMCMHVFSPVSLEGMCCSLELSPHLWVKAACLFIKQAVKSASYRTNTTVINSACLLSLTEDYPGAYWWFTEFTEIQPIFLAQQPSKCTRMFAEWTQLVHLCLSAFLRSFVRHPVVARFSTTGSDGHCCVRSAVHTRSTASRRQWSWPQ